MKSMSRPTQNASLRLFLLLGCLLIAGTAHAQWIWREANGSTTFSDSPPPPGIPPKDILRRPAVETIPDVVPSGQGGGGDAFTNSSPRPDPSANPGAANGAPAPGSGDSRPGPAGKTIAEQEADFRKRMEERHKAEQQQEEEEARAAERANNCTQAKGHLEMLQEGTRLLRTDPEGNRNFLDDDQRAAEIQKTQQDIEKNCS